jgi:hypothetical protein
VAECAALGRIHILPALMAGFGYADMYRGTAHELKIKLSAQNENAQ